MDGAARAEDRLRQSRGGTEYYFTIPKRCDALKELTTASGEINYVCGVYETRPQMCRDYDGSMKGPLGVKDCFWRLEKEGKPLPIPSLVRIEPPAR